MRARIDGAGLLIISADTGTEAYALKAWCHENIDLNSTDEKPKIWIECMIRRADETNQQGV